MGSEMCIRDSNKTNNPEMEIIVVTRNIALVTGLRLNGLTTTSKALNTASKANILNKIVSIYYYTSERQVDLLLLVFFSPIF